MQYFQMESSEPWGESYERLWETERYAQEMAYEGRIDGGEKILPKGHGKKLAHRLHLRLLFAVFSTLAFLFAMVVILVNSSQPVFPNLTTVDLLLAIVSYAGINVIIHLLFDRVPGKLNRGKHIIPRVIFIIASLLMLPVLCWMMVQGDNGLDGVLLILVSGIVAITLSYLTLCKKRHLHKSVR